MSQIIARGGGVENVSREIESWAAGYFNGQEVRTYADQKTYEIEVTGKTSELSGKQPSPGDKLSGWSGNATPEILGVRTSTITNDEAGIGTLRISCVVVNGDGAYDETMEVDVQEVQMSLKKHPHLDAAALSIIQLWEATPEAIRVFDNGGSIGFRYYDQDGKSLKRTLKTVSSSSNAYDYLYAYSSGIETYNVYLPVITRTTHYLRGYLSKISFSHLGTFDNPPTGVSGFSSGGKNWFKSADKASRNNDGTITRTEQWTYTNDTKHSWIYESS